MKKFNLSSITSRYRANLVLTIFEKWFKKGDKVLDVGSGTGVIAYMLKNHLGIKITTCDVKNYLLYKLTFIKITGNKLPFPNKTFSVILLIDVLHHIDKLKQEQLIIESLRVAKAVFIFESEPTFTGKVADIILNKFHYGDLNTPLTFRNTHEWKQLLKRLHLKYDYVKLDKPLWYPFSHIAFKVSKDR